MILNDNRFARDAELQRIARLLGLPPEQLDYLHQIDVASLRQFRLSTTAMLYDADSEALQRVASAAKLLPVSVIALIAEKAFGPLLCARIAALMPPALAIDVAKRLSTPMLADVCVLLDPRRARPVVEGIPTPRVVEVSLELARRNEYVTMGQFVDVLGFEALAAVIAKLKDDRALLKIAFFVEDRARLNQVVERLPEARFAGIIEAALADKGALWPEAIALISELELRWRRKFGELALSRGQALLIEMIHISDANGLLSNLIAIGGDAEDEVALRGLQKALSGLKPAVFKRLLIAAQNTQLFERLERSSSAAEG